MSIVYYTYSVFHPHNSYASLLCWLSRLFCVQFAHMTNRHSWHVTCRHNHDNWHYYTLSWDVQVNIVHSMCVFMPIYSKHFIQSICSIQFIACTNDFYPDQMLVLSWSNTSPKKDNDNDTKTTTIKSRPNRINKSSVCFLLLYEIFTPFDLVVCVCVYHSPKVAVFVFSANAILYIMLCTCRYSGYGIFIPFGFYLCFDAVWTNPIHLLVIKL